MKLNGVIKSNLALGGSHMNDIGIIMPRCHERVETGKSDHVDDLAAFHRTMCLF